MEISDGSEVLRGKVMPGMADVVSEAVFGFSVWGASNNGSNWLISERTCASSSWVWTKCVKGGLIRGLFVGIEVSISMSKSSMVWGDGFLEGFGDEGVSYVDKTFIQ